MLICGRVLYKERCRKYQDFLHFIKCFLQDTELINNSLPALTQEYSGYETTRQRLWYLRAKRMVCLLPLFCGHSAKITVLDNAACNLLRAISLVGLAFTPKGCSDRISPPFSKIRCWRGAFSFGCTMSSPEVIIRDGLLPAYCRHRISFGLKLSLTITSFIL